METKLKILCLHGYRQNANKFRSQTGALRKVLKNHANFHFISAPHEIPASSEGDEEHGEDQRGWWFTKHNTFSSKDVTDQQTGFEESLQLVESVFLKDGPFDGILGFSQGAALTAILCALKERKTLNISFNFVIIVSGFKSLCKQHFEFYDKHINTPSLHVIGETDRIILNEFSKQLAQVFENSVILSHPGGHFVPSSTPLKKSYIEFLTSQITS